MYLRTYVQHTNSGLCHWCDATPVTETTNKGVSTTKWNPDIVANVRTYIYTQQVPVNSNHISMAKTVVIYCAILLQSSQLSTAAAVPAPKGDP